MSNNINYLTLTDYINIEPNIIKHFKNESFINHLDFSIMSKEALYTLFSTYNYLIHNDTIIRLCDFDRFEEYEMTIILCEVPILLRSVLFREIIDFEDFDTDNVIEIMNALL